MSEIINTNRKVFKKTILHSTLKCSHAYKNVALLLERGRCFRKIYGRCVFSHLMKMLSYVGVVRLASVSLLFDLYICILCTMSVFMDFHSSRYSSQKKLAYILQKDCGLKSEMMYIKGIRFHFELMC